MSCGQCEVPKHLAYRHILKSIVKKLEEKNQKFSFSKLDLSLSVHMESAALLPPFNIIQCLFFFYPTVSLILFPRHIFHTVSPNIMYLESEDS